MQHEIVEKLRPLLSQFVQSEERVVYVLVEVRKLMEHANLPDDAYTTLRFFCNWVAHTKLTRGKGAAMVKAMNDIFEARTQGHRMTDEQYDELSRLFSFDRFREELLEFPGTHGLNNTAFESLTEWIAFTKHYASVVADCPVIYSKSDIPLKWMDRVVISTFDVEPEAIEHFRAERPFLQAPFGMRWAFFKGQREVLQWEVHSIFVSAHAEDREIVDEIYRAECAVTSAGPLHCAA